MMGLFIFNACYILNIVKAKRTSEVGMAMFHIDIELFKLGHPCQNILDYKQTRKLRKIVLLSCCGFFTFMTLFDFMVFRQ